MLAARESAPRAGNRGPAPRPELPFGKTVKSSLGGPRSLASKAFESCLIVLGPKSPERRDSGARPQGSVGRGAGGGAWHGARAQHTPASLSPSRHPDCLAWDFTQTPEPRSAPGLGFLLCAVKIAFLDTPQEDVPGGAGRFLDAYVCAPRCTWAGRDDRNLDYYCSSPRRIKAPGEHEGR